MDPTARWQLVLKTALSGILMTVLLAQGASSLECYKCTDKGDGGCAPDKIVIEQCPPRFNVCMEAVYTVIVGNMTVAVTQKGCDSGPIDNIEGSANGSVSYIQRYRSHACFENLCNKLVMEDTVKQNLHTQTANTSVIPRGPECYSCVSLSENQCSAQNAAIVRCQEESDICLEAKGTVTVGIIQNVTVPYFFKTCSSSSCSLVSTSVGQYINVKETASCCKENLCNGSPATEHSLIKYSILAALLAAMRL